MDLTTLGKVPVSDAAPAGEDVRGAPGFESLQGEIDKLTNPALGSTTDWPLVVKASAELLRDKGKDLLVACYLAGGLLETQGPAGPKTGLTVLADHPAGGHLRRLEGRGAGRRGSDKCADYHQLRRLTRSANDKALVSASEVVAWTEANAQVPVIGTNGFYVEDGGTLAIGTSPYEQGEVAGRMAVAIIEKAITPSSIPYASTRQYVVFMRHSQLQARNIVLPRVYEAFARAANTYFE